MVPAVNFKLIKLNEEMGGVRSEESTRLDRKKTRKPGSRSALDSVNGKGEASQWTDLSGPQERTSADTSATEDEEVRRHELGEGGAVGLLTALAL